MKNEKNERNDESSESETSSDELEREKTQNIQLENVMMSNSVTTMCDGCTIQCMTVIGQIEGHFILKNGQKATRYEQIIPLLVSVEENEDIDGLLIILNTVGGDVEAGLAIAEMIASMKKPTVSLVLGGGHSIGVPLAVSAKKSFIVPSATMTIHPVRTTGLVVSAPQTYNNFTRMQERIVDFIAGHSKIQPDTIRKMMLSSEDMATDMGTILEGKQAVEYGLIGGLGGLSDALAALKKMIKKEKNKSRK